MLPELPLLIPLCFDEEVEFTMDPAAWVQVAKADPTRWSILFAVPAGGAALVTTLPDVAFDVGVGMNNFGQLEYKFKDQLTYCQRAFYAYGKGSVGNMTVVTSCIRKRTMPNDGEGE